MGLGFNDRLQERAKFSVITSVQRQSRHLCTSMGSHTVKGLFQCPVALTVLLQEQKL